MPIVFIHEMDYQGIAEAPTLTQMATTLRTYSQISLTAISLAEFIRGLGYRAIPSANCTALNIPLAIDAGLGELGRNAKLIHPRFGPRCRISKVITDLPLEVDIPIAFGVTAFCDTCKKCARTCPGECHPDGRPLLRPGGRIQQLRGSAVAGRSRPLQEDSGKNRNQLRDLPPDLPLQQTRRDGPLDGQIPDCHDPSHESPDPPG